MAEEGRESEEMKGELEVDFAAVRTPECWCFDADSKPEGGCLAERRPECAADAVADAGPTRGVSTCHWKDAVDPMERTRGVEMWEGGCVWAPWGAAGAAEGGSEEREGHVSAAAAAEDAGVFVLAREVK
jgi:hypothetical protein